MRKDPVNPAPGGEVPGRTRRATERGPRNIKKPRRLNVPNVLSAFRMASIPVLWLFAAAGSERVLAIALAIVASTDVLDGAIARSWHVASDFGSRIDSIADHLLTVSVLLWIAWLRPGPLAEHAGWIVGLAGLAGVTLVVGWVRFRRIGGVHLISAKAAMLAGYIFAVALLYTGAYRPFHIYLVLGLSAVALLETFFVFLLGDPARPRVATIFTVLARRRDSRRGRVVTHD